MLIKKQLCLCINIFELPSMKFIMNLALNCQIFLLSVKVIIENNELLYTITSSKRINVFIKC